MIFHEGLDLPSFASIALLDDAAAMRKVERYFDGFLETAAAAGVGFVLDTLTWRGGLHWGAEIGRSRAEMARLNGEAARFAQKTRGRWAARVPCILVNGVVGPAGDGYAPDRTLSAAEAEATHRPQIEALVAAGVDMISAVTMTHAGEGIGVARAAAAAGRPVVVSYTVETDGRLPTGQPLPEAIEETDAATDTAPIYYMINCAHPDHFRGALAPGAGWMIRIGGLRSNASRLSHAELDAAEALDEGDPAEFGRLHGEIAGLFPNLRVVGGCCGTDRRHVACASRHLHRPAAA